MSSLVRDVHLRMWAEGIYYQVVRHFRADGTYGEDFTIQVFTGDVNLSHPRHGHLIVLDSYVAAGIDQEQVYTTLARWLDNLRPCAPDCTCRNQ